MCTTLAIQTHVAAFGEYPTRASNTLRLLTQQVKCVWQRIHDTLRANVRRTAGRHKHPTAGCLDSQSVNTSSVASEHEFDSRKQVSGRTRHILVDTLGLVMGVVVTAASVSDPAGARQVFRRMGGACKNLRQVWVDGTYRGTLVGWVAKHLWVRFQPVLRSEDMKGFVVLPRRWVVERTLAWLTRCRRLGREYERLSSSSEAMVYVAMTRLMLRRLAATKSS